MTRMIAFFLVAGIGIILRWVFVGEFELYQLLLASAFLIVSPIFLQINRVQRNKDTSYIPEPPTGAWSTSIKERWLTGEKKLYHDHQLVATYKREYQNIIQMATADLMNGSGLWHLELHFQFQNGRSYKVIGKESWRGDARHPILEGNTVVGEIVTVAKTKHAVKRLETNHLFIGDQSFEFRAKTTSSVIGIYKGEQCVGQVSAQHNGVRTLDLKPGHVTEAEESLLLIGWIVFSYRFKK
ncbi:hypothetical protein [Alteribacter aurantiacus]|uniref:hypothetical protein n=1 Tax=Alteribacter aurantiacus TaxID=254410 RepID=UPI000416D47B|nr:hypothetical protein [Alteribacter aurantiacus]